MDVTTKGLVGRPSPRGDGVETPLRAGQEGDLIVTQLHGRYYEQALRGNLYVAHAIVTAPVIYTTAAGTGGPLLWNNTSDKRAVILAIGVGVTVVTTVAAALGISGNTGQTAAPGTTTAIDSHGPTRIGAGASPMSLYRIGTPTNAVTATSGFFMPLMHLHTGALTVDNVGACWVDIGGAVVVDPQCWASVSASATATTTVAQISMLYEVVSIP